MALDSFSHCMLKILLGQSVTVKRELQEMFSAVSG